MKNRELRTAESCSAAPLLTKLEEKGSGIVMDRRESEAPDPLDSHTCAKPPTVLQHWKEMLAPYQSPAIWRSVWQIINTFVPYGILWYLMYRSMAVSYWLTLPLAILAAGFMIRIFIIFHDCGHGSFFKSRKANAVVGFIAGMLTFTPYYHWRWQHAQHHGTAGDLDRRGMGDVWTMTVQEYIDASPWTRIAYRLTRNPITLFVLAPVFLFIVGQRFVSAGAPPRERRSVHWTNLAILIMAATLTWFFGWKAYVLIQVTVLAIGDSVGVWLFYVQHQFEGVYWARHGEWNSTKVALQGSSFYRLPKVLQWFTGNIGFHHIHHLEPRIPNYNLEKCHKEVPLFQTVKPVTLFSSLKSLSYRLWDEQRQRLVGYRHMRRIRRQMALAARC